MSKYDELVARQRAASDARPPRCACLCGGKLIAGRRVASRYINEKHKQRAYRARVAARAADQGLVARSGVLSFGALDPASGSGSRNGDAAKPRQRRQAAKREGVSVYFPTLAIAKAARLALAGVPEARRAVDRALSRRRAREGTTT